MGHSKLIGRGATSLLCFFSASFAMSACASDSQPTSELRVPSQYSTIAKAVDAAKSGATIVVAPGTYHESVTITTEGITLRGEDRNTVILDGEDTLLNGVLVAANNVAVENLTVHSFNQNGVVFNGIQALTQKGGVDPTVVYGADDNVLKGFRVSYVTAYNNGLYGIYAFASRDGVIEYSYASGHPDSGIYVGQCKPCNTVIRASTAERNAIGYYGTNASDVKIVESIFRNNRLGIAPNSQRAEKLEPQGDTTIAGNLVTDNDDATAPRIPAGYFGGGIAVGGGNRNLIIRNRVSGHVRAGIEVTMIAGFQPKGNRIEGNVLVDNGFDLVYAPKGAHNANGNCFAKNVFSTSYPDKIEDLMPCDAPSRSFTPPSELLLAAPPGVDYRLIPPPGPHPTMPTPYTFVGAGPVPIININDIVVPK